MKRLTIIPLNKAASLIPKIMNMNSLCYYIADDYAQLVDLQNKFKEFIKINTLSGIFHETFQEIKLPIIELTSTINRKYHSFEWWGSQVASRNSASTPLLLNITFLFSAKKIFVKAHENLIFILKSRALSDCISIEAIKNRYQVVSYWSIFNRYTKTLKLWFYYSAQIIYFLRQILQSRKTAFTLSQPLLQKKSWAIKRIIIRSWVTKSNFDKSGNFTDRNFGRLPSWLRSKNYEVWILPMFFNLSMKIKNVYELLKKQDTSYLIPDCFLKYSDYLTVLLNSYRVLRIKIENIEINKTNIAPIFNEVLRDCGFDPFLALLNLSSLLIKRLKEKNFEVDRFYYAFESNAPEKQFILSCRKYFPNSEIIGYQHTTFFSNQLAYHLGSNEKEYHPLPSKIICSGPLYVELHKKAGFPPEILVTGPSLRFEIPNTYIIEKRNFLGQKKILLLPLTFSYDLAIDLFVKLNQILKDLQDYRILIRCHPFLSKKRLIYYLGRIGMNNYEFADEGIIQDWLSQTYAVISNGGSITILEAISMGTPAIRVIPDNTFFYDPFIWPDYPLKPVSSSSEINLQLHLIAKMMMIDEEVFSKLAKQVVSQYFTNVTEDNLRTFL